MAISIGTVSYAAAAMAFLFLSVLLVTTWRGRLQGMLLAVACLGTAMWAGVAAYLAARSNAAMLAAEVLEVLRSAVWFAFLMVLLGYSRKAVGSLRRAAVGLAAFCGLVLAATLYSGVVSAPRPEMFGILGRLVLAVIGIVLVEQLYRNVPPSPRHRNLIPHLCCGGTLR